jgi:hypothetical protein
VLSSKNEDRCHLLRGWSSGCGMCGLNGGGLASRICVGISVSKSSPVQFFDLFLDRPDLRPVA